MMRTGIAWDEDRSAPPDFGAVLGQKTTYRDRLLSVGAAAVPQPEQTGFNYDTNATEMLGRVVDAATGGFTNYFAGSVWANVGPEGDAWWAVDREGFPLVAGGLYALPRDYLRFGIYLEESLRQGSANGCLREYLRAATRTQIKTEKNHARGYGYQFWTEGEAVRELPAVFEMRGFWGQRILIDPERRAVGVLLSAGGGDLRSFYRVFGQFQQAK